MRRVLLVLGLTLLACESSNDPAQTGELDARASAPTDDASIATEDARADSALDAASDPLPDASEDARVVEQTDAGPDAAQDAQAPRDAAPPPPSTACNVTAPTTCPEPAPRYADVAPIFQERCVVCHSPLWTGPWPLDAYEHVADWQADIRANLIACTMPPPEANSPMTNEERLAILTWLRCGLPK